MNTLSCKHWICAFAGVVLVTGAARASMLLGRDVVTSSRAYDATHSGPLFTRTDTVVDPGVEISYGDPQAITWNWMKPGDSVDIAPYANPSAPWQYHLEFGPTHVFPFGSYLWLKFELPADLQYGAAAIVEVTNFQGVVANKSAQAMEVLISDMWRVSQGDYGGSLTISFNVLPEPTSSLGFLSAAALLLRRRRGV